MDKGVVSVCTRTAAWECMQHSLRAPTAPCTRASVSGVVEARAALTAASHRDTMSLPSPAAHENSASNTPSTQELEEVRVGVEDTTKSHSASSCWSCEGEKGLARRMERAGVILSESSVVGRGEKEAVEEEEREAHSFVLTLRLSLPPCPL